MTPQQEEKFDDMHDAVIRMEAVLSEKVENHDKTLYGNGKPGVKEEVALLKQSHLDCKKRQEQKPSKLSNLIAIGALLVAVVSIWIK